MLLCTCSHYLHTDADGLGCPAPQLTSGEPWTGCRLLPDAATLPIRSFEKHFGALGNGGWTARVRGTTVGEERPQGKGPAAWPGYPELPGTHVCWGLSRARVSVPRDFRQRTPSLQPRREAQAPSSLPPSQGGNVALLRVRKALRKAVSQPQGSDTSHPSLQVG